MPELPTKQSEFLAFCTAHIPIWTQNAAALGVLPASVLTFKNRAQAAQATFDAAESARVAAKAATNTNDGAMRTARSDAADLIRTIRAFAESTNNTNVYSLAGISPPARPTPAPAPMRPTDLSTGLETSGALTLYWKASNPRGGTVTYAIGRKLPGENTFTMVANTGGNAGANGRPTGRRGLKQWTDATVPVNSNGVQYVITGTRGDIMGEMSEVLTVTFGVAGGGGGGGGGMFIASTTTTPSTGIKMAA